MQLARAVIHAAMSSQRRPAGETGMSMIGGGASDPTSKSRQTDACGPHSLASNPTATTEYRPGLSEMGSQASTPSSGVHDAPVIAMPRAGLSQSVSSTQNKMRV